jgi:hypothetical protein
LSQQDRTALSVELYSHHYFNAILFPSQHHHYHHHYHGWIAVNSLQSRPRKMATRPTAPVNGFAALARAAPDDAAAVDDPVADPTLPELAAEPDAADREAEAEADLALLAALTLSLALALAALPLGVGVTIAVAVSLSAKP